MNAEIICVGTELLLGDTLNTNSQYIARRLAECGISLYSQSVVGDNRGRLLAQLKESMNRCDIIILSGGLGPTEDDLTKEVVAEALHLPLELHTRSLALIEQFFAKTGRVMSENNKKQALTIRGARVLENRFGTAPGYIVENSKNKFILLPGPPKELVPMFEEYVLPFLKSLSDEVIYSESVRVFGIGESLVATQCGELLHSQNPTVSTYAHSGEVQIRVTAKAESESAAKTVVKPFVEKLIKQFGTNVYTITDETLQEKVVALLSRQGRKIGVAESCTAGMLSSRLTEVPGSSLVFDMGVSAYANHIKVNTLGVSEKVIEKEGAVSSEVAAQMAVGIREVSKADVGVGITGVAGPGQSEGKPAGLVYIAISDGSKVYVRKIMCRGMDRDNTRIMATSTALDMVRRYLENAEDLLSFGTYLGDPINLMEGYYLPEAAPLSLEGRIPEKFRELQKKLSFGDEEMLRLIALMENDEFPLSSDQKDLDSEFDFDESPKKERYEETLEETAVSTEVEDSTAQISLFDTEVAPALAEQDEDNATATAKEPTNDISLLFANDLAIMGGETHIFRSEKKRNLQKNKRNTKPAKPEKIKKEKAKQNRSVSDKEVKKSAFFALFPNKKDSRAEKVRKTAFLASFLVLVCSVVFLISYISTGTKVENIYNDLSAVYHAADTAKGETRDADGHLLAFSELKAQNPDIKGWIKIDDTKIDYPVYQTDNNDFYLNHDMNKERNRYGALYLDMVSQIGSSRNGRNIVIYGHSMRDGSMFGQLKKYLDYSFYKEHPTFDFNTIYNKATYKVFAVFITNSLPESDNGQVFEYRQSAFKNEAEFVNFVSELRKRSVITTNIDVHFDDEILTLSTCAYDFKDAKLVVMARKVRSEDDYYTPIVASVNPAPHYPAAWYEKKGQQNPNETPGGTESDISPTPDVPLDIPTDIETSSNIYDHIGAPENTTSASGTGGGATLVTPTPNSPSDGEETTTPPTGETSSDSGTTPPAAETPSEGEGTTPPAAETPSEGTTSSGGEGTTPPAGEGTTEGAENTTTSGEATSPAEQGSTPAP